MSEQRDIVDEGRAAGGAAHSAVGAATPSIRAAGAAGAPGAEVHAEDIIIVENVHKWYGDFHVFRGVSTRVRRGEKVVICGPSGSGKSTFIRTLNGLESHQEGRIIVNGTELTGNMKNLEAVREETGMVFQQFNLFPHLTVLQNITLGPIWVRKMKKQEANELAMRLLERVGIPEQADKYPGQLSGGQQQRVAIARALAMQPKIMLFDEPTSSAGPGNDSRSAGRHAGTSSLRHDDACRDTRNGLCP